MKTKLLLVLVALGLAACASNRPVLYAASGAVPGGADAAIAEGEKLATTAGAQPSGGQVGETARNTAYVERCLKDRGFDPVGWQ